MKKRMKTIVCLAAVILCMTTNVYAAAAPLLGTPEADRFGDTDILLIQDPNADAPLVNKNEDKVFQPVGGTVAWMTALLSCEKLPPDQKIEIGALKGVDDDARTIGLRPGHSATVRDLLAALLLYGAQDSAIALADAAANSVEAFIPMMNAKAKELGMTQTQYVNPTGAQADGQQTTASDTLLLAKAVLNNPMLSELLSMEEYTVDPGTDALRDETIQNRCTLMQSDHPAYAKEVTGAALGVTKQTGTVAIISAQKDASSTAMIIIFNDLTPPEDFEANVQEFMNYGFSFEKIDLLPYTKLIASHMALKAGKTSVTSCEVADQSLIFEARPGFHNEFLSMDLRLVVDENTITPDVAPNQPVATAALYYQDTKLTDVTLLAKTVETAAVTEPTAAPPSVSVSLLEPASQNAAAIHSSIGQRYQWLIWPAGAAVLALILVFLCKGILRRIL